MRAVDDTETYCLSKRNFREALEMSAGFKEQVRQTYFHRYPARRRLELLDQRGQCRLRDTQRHRGAGEAAVVGEVHERDEMVLGNSHISLEIRRVREGRQIIPMNR